MARSLSQAIYLESIADRRRSVSHEEEGKRKEPSLSDSCPSLLENLPFSLYNLIKRRTCPRKGASQSRISFDHSRYPARSIVNPPRLTAQQRNETKPGRAGRKRGAESASPESFRC